MIDHNINIEEGCNRSYWQTIRNCLLITLVIGVIAESIGTISIEAFGITLKILSIIWAILIAILLSPALIGNIVKPIKKLITKKEINASGNLIAIALYPLGIMFGIYAGPRIGVVLEAGPALILQEAGNISTMLIAMPVGLMLGLGRTAFGSTVTICRDTTLGIIGDKYGLQSPEGIGTLGTYIFGSIFGSLLFTFLAPLGIFMGLHPYALATASGMGSASMMGAATASLVAAAPAAMTENIMAFSATSGLLTAVTGVYVELFIAVPLANAYYRKIAPIFSGNTNKLNQQLAQN